MTIFEALHADHDIQRELLAKLVETSGDTKERKMLYKKVKDELQRHAVAEERFFYSPLIDSDTTIELSRHGIAEHHEIDEFIESLDDMEMSSPAWLVTAKKLQEKVSHHLAEEEREFFPVAGRVLNDKQKNQLAREYQQEMDDAAAA